MAEVAAAVGTEAPECYICMEPETAIMPFLRRTMCACSSKADSSLKVHQLCLELSRDRTGKCAVCKTALSSDWAFDQTFARTGAYYATTRTFTQMQGHAKHGAEYTLKPTNAYKGPMRWLAAKGQYADDRLHGPQFTYAADGSAATECNYAAGVLHGLLVERNAKGVVTLSETYADGKLHGPRSQLHYDIQLTGNYEHGIKVGQHLEVGKRDYGQLSLINRATYKAGVLDGPFLQYHIQTGESQPLETAVYRDGKLNGLQEKWSINPVTSEREQMEESHWIEGQRNGRHAVFQCGELMEETWYHMDKKHGLERFFFPDGSLQQETSWHLGEKHGRYRKWTQEYGKRTLDIDAAYDNGFRHGRFVTKKYYYSDSSDSNIVETEDFWSDGTKELRHGMHRIAEGSRITREVHYKMGVRHGLSLKRDKYDAGFVLNYKNGKLHGKCQVMYNDRVTAEGHFRDGVPVGKHVLFHQSIYLKESVNYDSEGRLHGKCIFNQSNGTPFQAFNYEHGVLHGRQVIFHAGTSKEKRVFNMRKGYVHGRFTLYDERGAIEEEQLLKKDDGISLQECLGPDALCAPSERLANGTFEHRWMDADGNIYECKHAAAGRSCNCEYCYTPPMEEAECNCAFCCADNYDEGYYEAGEDLHDQTSYGDEEEYVDRSGWDSEEEREARRDRYRYSRWNY